MSTIKILRGIQGIGKSTYAKQLIEKEPYVRFNKDDIRLMESATYAKSNGELVDDVMHGFIEAALKQNLNIVLDNTFCFLKHIDDIINRYHIYADIEIICFPNDIELALTQNNLRQGHQKIDEKIIRDFSAAYKKSEYTLRERKYNMHSIVCPGMVLGVYSVSKHTVIPYQYNDDLPDIIVWDIDNTLSIKGDRGIYEFDKCGLDSVINSTYNIYNVFESYDSMYEFDRYHKPTKQIFITGRGEECRQETLYWLQDNVCFNVQNHHLLMRPAKDFRRDSVVKEEIYKNHLEGQYNIIAWFDDSPKVRKEFLIPYKIPFFDTTYSTYE